MSRSRVLYLLLLTVATLLAPPANAAPACPPGLGIGLVEFPKGSHDPRAQNYVIDHVAPGTRFSRRFQVCNGTSQPITVQLYPGAAEIDAGGFHIVEGRGRSELTSWVAVDPRQVTVSPGQRVLARATFTVPAAAESGERYGVLLAELPPTSAAGVQVASRVGIRIYLDVGPGGEPHSDFAVDALQAARDAQGDALVTALVHNTGRRALDMTGSLTLTAGPSGLSGGPYSATVGTTLAPGQSEPVLVRVGPAVAAGPWVATLTLRAGLLERKVRAAVTFPAAGAQATPVLVQPVRPDHALSRTPVAVAIGLLALVLAALVAWRRRTSAQ